MAWETRGNSSYYYHKVRRNGRVVSEYLGAGPLGVLAAMMDQADQERQALERQTLKEEREAQQAIDQRIDQVIAQGKQLAAAHLLANNYHRHKGTWRRRREPIGP